MVDINIDAAKKNIEQKGFLDIEMYCLEKSS